MTAIPASQPIQVPPLTSPDVAVHTDTEPRTTVRERVAYLREWAKYGRDWCAYIEQEHMTRMNHRLDAILGINR